MAGPKSPRMSSKPKDSARRGKKKISPISTERLAYIDYKDVDLLRRFVSDRAKIRGRYATGNDSQQQKVVSSAVKNAREMGLLPYASRVTTMRRGRGGRRDDERGERGDRNERPERDESPEIESLGIQEFAGTDENEGDE
jgi:small subunit ribosomal protein S18